MVSKEPIPEEVAYFYGLAAQRGMDSEMAADLGYATDAESFNRQITAGKRVAELSARGNEATLQDPQQFRRQKIARAAGGPVCGDCGVQPPCSHRGVGRNGKQYSVG